MTISEQYLSKMQRPGLYNIQAIDNIPSILEHGLLCYDLAETILDEHVSVALASVQGRRSQIKIPNGLKLHEYANLYFDFWNPMLSKVRDKNEDICILRFDASVLDIDDVVVTDRNAAASFATFFNTKEGLEALDFDLIYTKWFAAPYYEEKDHYAESNVRHIKCAEVLVPHSIPSEYINAAAVVSDSAKERLAAAGFDKTILVRRNDFF